MDKLSQMMLMGAGVSLPIGYQFLASFSEQDLSGTFSFTYNNVNLGSAADNRAILGISYASSLSSGALNLNTATFKGVSATRVINHSGTQLGGFNHAAYFLAYVQQGTSGTVSWGGEYSGDAVGTRAHLVLYALYGNPTVISDNISSSGGLSTNTRSANLSSVAVGDILFALAGNNSSSTHTYSPAFYEIDYNQTFDGNRTRTVASGEATSSGTVTTQVTFSNTGIQANLSTVAIRL
jgi:hypothetical protein